MTTTQDLNPTTDASIRQRNIAEGPDSSAILTSTDRMALMTAVCDRHQRNAHLRTSVSGTDTKAQRCAKSPNMQHHRQQHAAATREAGFGAAIISKLATTVRRNLTDGMDTDEVIAVIAKSG